MKSQIVKSVVMLLACVIVCYAAAGVGAFFTAQSVADWYPTIDKPDWTPTGRTIGMVWQVLYTLMGIAAWLIWRHTGFAGAKPAWILFAIQLGLNVLWSALFFGLRSPGAAMVELVLLEAVIIATMIVFMRHHVVAGLLMLPYAAWVAFAGVLNFAIWQMNP